MRIVIADDHAIVRDGMRSMLQATGEAEVVAEAVNGIEAITAVKKHKPDLALLDISMPYAGGLEVIGEILQWSPDTRIVVFTGVATFGVISELIDRNVDGILLKSCSAGELECGIAALLNGQSFICEEAQRLAGKAGALTTLTRREKQVLHQVVLGANNASIAETLNISPKTVDNHRTNLMRKLDVHSLSGLIRVALREGLVPSEDLAAHHPTR